MTLKPWLATYRDNGIPETVNADAWPSVVHLLEDAMRRYADKPAFRAFGQTAAGLNVMAHRQGQRVIPTPMPQRQLIMEKTGRH